MRSGLSTRTTIPSATSATEQPRLTLRMKLKPKAPTTGYVDGAWWPRSRDLLAEIPALIAALTVRLGDIERVTYHLASWDAAPTRLPTRLGRVRLDGFRSQHADTVTVVGAGGQHRLTLLVVPPETIPAAAQHMLVTASQRANPDPIHTLLTHGADGGDAAPSTDSSHGSDPATQRWEIDGGHFYEPVQLRST